jgi:hypothetical protein
MIFFLLPGGDAVEKENGYFTLSTVAGPSSSYDLGFVLGRRGVCPAALWHYCGDGDRPNACLSSATVTVTNTETQESKTVVTSATGDYPYPTS